MRVLSARARDAKIPPDARAAAARNVVGAAGDLASYAQTLRIAADPRFRPAKTEAASLEAEARAVLRTAYDERGPEEA